MRKQRGAVSVRPHAEQNEVERRNRFIGEEGAYLRLIAIRLRVQVVALRAYGECSPQVEEPSREASLAPYGSCYPASRAERRVHPQKTGEPAPNLSNLGTEVLKEARRVAREWSRPQEPRETAP